MNTIRFARLSALAAIPVFAFADQISKWYVIERLFRPVSFDAHAAGMGFWQWLATTGQDQFPFYSRAVTPFFNLVMVWNKGVSFGMFASAHAYMPYALMALAMGMSVFFLFWLRNAKSALATWPIALIISGALSNAWDRMRFGAVADFLDLHWRDMHWPAFNIADSGIVIGVAGLALYTLFFENKTSATRQDATETRSAETP